MNEQIKPNFEFMAWLLIGIGTIITIVMLVLFSVNRNYQLDQPIQNDVFGQSGDIIGGVVGSLISLVGVLLLFETLAQQREQFSTQQTEANKALTAQREQFDEQQEKSDLFFKKEQIESRFFELLKIHRENVNDIRIGDIYGRRIFMTLERELSYTYLYVKHVCSYTENDLSIKDKINIAYLCFFYGAVGTKSEKTISNALSKYDDKLTKRILEILKEKQGATQELGEFRYKPFEGHQSRLGHYFRNLYQTVKYINQVDKLILSYRDKYGYVSTLRAQFSTHEQALLLWNSLSDLGGAWEKKVVDENLMLITKYNLIRNIPVGFIQSFDPTDFYSNVAYEGQDEPPQRIELKKKYY